MEPTDRPRADGSRPAWTREQAAGLERTADTVAPVFYPPEEPFAPELHVWDTWLLRDRSGAVADVDGWRVAFSLTAPADLLPGKRHDVATVRYFYSRDGHTWHGGAPVFEGDALGSRQWAGSALYDPDGGDRDVYVFYTAAGHRDEAELSYQQRIAGAAGGTLRVDGGGVAVEGPWTHEVLLTPDGERYETEAQSRGMTYTFRDPWFFEDPATGETHLLFEANVPVAEGSDACGGDAVQQEFNGAVGLATSPTGDPMDWRLEPPLLDAVCVNQELERPHVVVLDGRYYLFFPSHQHTFAPGLAGFDGLYGFVADELRGDYRPLNDTGLVVANPTSAPFQAYSFVAFRHREDVLVGSFFNYYDFEGATLDAIADLPEREQFRRFGGTLSPTLRLQVEGRRTRVRGKLPHGYVPLEREALPDHEEVGGRRARTRADPRTDDARRGEYARQGGYARQGPYVGDHRERP